MKKKKENADLDDVIEEMPENDDLPSNTDTEKEEEEMPKDTEIDSLRAEIEALRAELDAKKREGERLFSEIAELALTFPYITLNSITEEIWQSSKEGIPLAAAYALYEKKREAANGYAKEINKRNAQRSSGAVTNSGDSGYYTPAEVRKMSSDEVKKNYKFIIESMKKWN